MKIDSQLYERMVSLTKAVLGDPLVSTSLKLQALQITEQIDKPRRISPFIREQPLKENFSRFVLSSPRRADETSRFRIKVTYGT